MAQDIYLQFEDGEVVGPVDLDGMKEVALTTSRAIRSLKVGNDYWLYVPGQGEEWVSRVRFLLAPLHIEGARRAGHELSCLQFIAAFAFTLGSLTLIAWIWGFGGDELLAIGVGGELVGFASKAKLWHNSRKKDRTQNV